MFCGYKLIYEQYPDNLSLRPGTSSLLKSTYILYLQRFNIIFLKKPLLRFFALLPLVPLGASAMIYFFFGIAQFQYKIIAEHIIAEQRGVTSIKIPLSDFKKQSDNKEIWYGGKLYDVSRYSIENDSVCLAIFHDEQEESLIKRIADNFEPSDSYAPNDGVHIVKHRIHIPDDVKIKPTATILHLYLTVTYKKGDLLPYFIQYSSGAHASILKPPPDIA